MGRAVGAVREGTTAKVLVMRGCGHHLNFETGIIVFGLRRGLDGRSIKIKDIEKWIIVKEVDRRGTSTVACGPCLLTR